MSNEPTAVPLYINDLESMLINFQSDGEIIEKKNFRLDYADDIVHLSDRESEMKEMMGLLSRYTKGSY